MKSKNKKYIITKVIFAKNLPEATKKEKESEIVQIELVEHVTEENITSKLGF